MQATIQTAPQARSIAAGTVRHAATPDALDLLEQFGTTVAVQREHEIHGQGDNADYCWRILSGCVRTVKLMEDGRRQVGGFLFTGDLLGLDDLGTHDFSAEAVTDVTLRRYPRRMVEALADSHAALARRLRAVALDSLRDAHDRMIMLGRKTAVEKVASFVLEMDRSGTAPGDRMPGDRMPGDRMPAGKMPGGRVPAGKMTEMPMSRTDIADYLGLTVETVCRILAHLKREGVVALHRTGVQVVDRACLRAAASDSRH